ncbi:hypothetical protein PACILC2_08430 [Paenibacillus cisolokensis]|uniref:Uncharacterized protein n=1 Tax=Paenibacillus cisolokensis TaxID=1658519 RepID=A0ABQ4N275_9BACL|nr:hypothetical protein [Paenibacillus cisolokensis]GIQ62275.1 hypothetical protein PACILC2_08430 [Paenibacillus cisolokensis]
MRALNDCERPGYPDNAIYAAGDNPYGTSATVNNDGTFAGKVLDAAKHQARRTIQIAEWVKKGRSESFSKYNSSQNTTLHKKRRNA